MRIIITFFLITSISQLYSQPLTARQIDTLAERTMAAFNVPGIAIGIVKDGKLIHARGYGLRSLNSRAKLDENTLFGIASNTKAFTTTALGLLVEEGKIKWDYRVRDIIPEFKLYDPYVTEAFTIRDLLTHRSGLGLGAGDLMRFPDSSDFSLHDIIYNLRFLKPVSGFRAKYDYDNNFYILAGEVVARVSGKSWEDFVEERIMQPIGMDHSAATYDRLKDRSNVVDPHALVDGKLRVVARRSARTGQSAGAIYSNITDLAKWVMLHLSHGKYGEGRQLFSDRMHEELWSPQTIIPVSGPGPYNTHFSAYGLGFHLSDVRGFKQVNHTGGHPGMVTQITMIPELNLGIIVLTNQEDAGAFRAIADQIKDAYFGIPNTDRVNQYAQAGKQAVMAARSVTDSIWKEIARVEQQSIKPEATVYTGTYRDPWFGEVVISQKNGKLWFDSKRSPRLTGELFSYKGNSFVVRWKDRSMDADAFINFTLDLEGKASHFTMKAISPLTDFSYDFQDLDFSRVR